MSCRRNPNAGLLAYSPSDKNFLSEVLSDCFVGDDPVQGVNLSSDLPPGRADTVGPGRQIGRTQWSENVQDALYSRLYFFTASVPDKRRILCHITAIVNQFENLGKNRVIGPGMRMLTTDTRAFSREHHSVHAVQKLLNLGVVVADFPLNTLLGDIGGNIRLANMAVSLPLFRADAIRNICPEDSRQERRHP